MGSHPGSQTPRYKYIYYIYVPILLPPGNFSIRRSTVPYTDQNTVFKQIIRDYAYIQTNNTRIKYQVIKANICKYSNISGSVTGVKHS